MILGVSLIVDDLHKGQKLVCRYPDSMPEALATAALNTSERNPNQNRSTPSQALAKHYRTYLNFNHDNFAKLFRPKAGLNNKVFDLVIDDLQYISYPCPCGAFLNSNRGDADEAFAHGNAGNSGGASSSGVNHNNEGHASNISLFTLVIAKIRDSTMLKILETSNSASHYSNTDCFADIVREYGSVDVHGAAHSWSSVWTGGSPGTDPLSIALGLRRNLHYSLSYGSICAVVTTYSQALLLAERTQSYVSREVALLFELTLEKHAASSGGESKAKVGAGAGAGASSKESTLSTKEGKEKEREKEREKEKEMEMEKERLKGQHEAKEKEKDAVVEKNASTAAIDNAGTATAVADAATIGEKLTAAAGVGVGKDDATEKRTGAQATPGAAPETETLPPAAVAAPAALTSTHTLTETLTHTASTAGAGALVAPAAPAGAGDAPTAAAGAAVGAGAERKEGNSSTETETETGSGQELEEEEKEKAGTGAGAGAGPAGTASIEPVGATDAASGTPIAPAATADAPAAAGSSNAEKDKDKDKGKDNGATKATATATAVGAGIDGASKTVASDQLKEGNEVLAAAPAPVAVAAASHDSALEPKEDKKEKEKKKESSNAGSADSSDGDGDGEGGKNRDKGGGGGAGSSPGSPSSTPVASPAKGKTGGSKVSAGAGGDGDADGGGGRAGRSPKPIVVSIPVGGGGSPSAAAAAAAVSVSASAPAPAALASASGDVSSTATDSVVLTVSGALCLAPTDTIGKSLSESAIISSTDSPLSDRTFSGVNIGHSISSSAATTTGNDLSAGSNGGNAVKSADSHGFGSTALSIESLLMNSTLLNELRCLYHGLMGGHSVVMRVDRTIDIHVPLFTAKSCLLHQESSSQSGIEGQSWGGDGYLRAAQVDLFPLPDYPYDFLTLLTFGEADELQDFLTRNDAGRPNPILLSLLETSVPTMSITELASTTELTSEECWEMALHLQTWGLACIIPLLTAQSQLYVHPFAPMSSTSPASLAFAAAFLGQAALVEPENRRGGGAGEFAGSSSNNLLGIHKLEGSKRKAPNAPYSLPCFLAVFDGTRPLSKCISLLPAALQAHALDATLWLLRRRMLVNPVPFHAPEEEAAARALRQRHPLL